MGHERTKQALDKLGIAARDVVNLLRIHAEETSELGEDHPAVAERAAYWRNTVKAFELIAASDQPLHAAFDRLMRGRSWACRSGRVLFDAFMAGAGAYDRIISEARRSDDPEHVAKVQDLLAEEISRARFEPRGECKGGTT